MAQHYLETLLGERERIQYVTHQHWIILARNIALEIITIILTLIGITLAILFFPGFPPALTILIGFAILLIPVISMSRDFLTYSNRQYVITNRRVIAISGVLDKSTVDSSLEKVNDVHMTQSAMGRIFNYGDVEILTASELGANNFKQIADPVRFKTAMLNAKQSLEDRDDIAAVFPSAAAAAPAAAAPVALAPEDIPTLLARLGALHQEGVLSDDEFNRKKAELLERL